MYDLRAKNNRQHHLRRQKKNNNIEESQGNLFWVVRWDVRLGTRISHTKQAKAAALQGLPDDGVLNYGCISRFSWYKFVAPMTSDELMNLLHFQWKSRGHEASRVLRLIADVRFAFWSPFKLMEKRIFFFPVPGLMDLTRGWSVLIAEVVSYDKVFSYY